MRRFHYWREASPRSPRSLRKKPETQRTRRSQSKVKRPTAVRVVELARSRTIEHTLTLGNSVSIQDLLSSPSKELTLSSQVRLSHVRTAIRNLVMSLAVTAIWAIPSASDAGMLVPAYFYPGTGGPGGAGDGWAAMAAAAATIPVTAVFNPNSGPLPGLADPNYVNALTNLEAAGGSVVAYIHTSYGGQPLATVEGEVNLYISQYGPLVNGFFVDEMANDAGHVAYYHDLYQFIKGLNPSYQVIGNPGAATLPAYLDPITQGADVLVTDETNDQTNPYTATVPAAWTLGFPAKDFASIIYNQPKVAGMAADVNYAATHNV